MLEMQAHPVVSSSSILDQFQDAKASASRDRDPFGPITSFSEAPALVGSKSRLMGMGSVLLCERVRPRQTV